MKMSQILSKQKCHFFFTKSQNRSTEQVMSGGVCISQTGENVKNECRSVNILQILYTHACK
jgi:hypothetical protein